MTKSFPLHKIREAAVQAEEEGKALVTVGERGVLALVYYPISRLSPLVVGDGNDLLRIEEACPEFDCDVHDCINCRHHDCGRCGMSLGAHDRE